MDFMFDLQLFAVSFSGGDGKSTADGKAAYYIGDTEQGGGWYAGTGGASNNITAGYPAASAGTKVYATYGTGSLFVAGDAGVSVTIGDSDSYKVYVGTTGISDGTAGTAGTVSAAVGTAASGTFNVFGVNAAIETAAGEAFTVANGRISALAGTVGFDGKNEALNVKVGTLTATDNFKIGDKAVSGTDMTGNFGYNGTEVAYLYEAVDTTKGQQINLSAQSTAWSVKGSSQGDTIISSALADSISSGAGKDSVTITNGNNGAHVNAEDGDDTVTFAANGTNVYVDLGAGNDTVTQTAAGVLKGVTIVSADGNNDVILSSGTVTDSTVSLGGGADSVQIGSDANSTGNTIYVGAGNDTVVAVGTSTVYGGDGVDVFNATVTGASVSIADYTLDDVIYVASGTVDTIRKAAGTGLANATVSAAITGGAAVELNAVGGNYYAAQFKDANENQYVGWVGADDAATIDASGLTKSAVLVGRGNGETGDALIGSAKADTIYAGTNDTVTAGEGNDVIKLDTGKKTANTINVNAASGKDTVDNFTGGYTEGESDAVVIDGLTSTSGLKVSYSGSSVTMKGGSTTLTLNMDAGASTDAAALLVNGQKAVAIKADTYYTVSEDSIPAYFFGSNSGVNYSAVQDALEVKLSDTEKFHGVTALTGGAGDSTLWGSSSKETIVAGSGATSMTSGAGADSMKGGVSEDTFFYLAGDGRDTISSFGEYVVDGSNNDLLNTYGNAITKATRVDSSTVKVTVGGASNDVLTLVTEKSTNNQNAMIQFTDGTNKGIAKIGYAAKANTFSYDANTTAYLGGSATDVISVASSNNDDLKIWLDGSQGVAYGSIEVINDNGKGNNQLAGDTASQSIQAGSGNDSLWGGTGTASDTLRGGSGSDMFFYGYGEGKDVLQNVGADDLVNLYSLNLSQLTGYEIGSSSISVTTTTGDSLTVNKASSAATTTFRLSDGSQWTANYSTKTWEQG